MSYKFALRSMAGKPFRFYTVDQTKVIPSDAPQSRKTHHIALIDVSGSMYHDLEGVKATLEKVLVGSEFSDPDQIVSVLTYSSNGDCQPLFTRVKVAEVLAPGSKHLAALRALRVRGLTGMSQSLFQAAALVNDSELTAITLHTDGYANDPSPSAEAKGIADAIRKLETLPNVFVNTVAYRDYCDFPLLDLIANRLSGKAIRAKSAKEVFDALENTQKVLSKASPTLEVGIGDHDYLCVVSHRDRLCLGGKDSLQVRGLTGDAFAFRFKEVDEATFDSSPLPEGHGLLGGEAIFALARTALANGDLRTAKGALMASKTPFIIQRHITALVGEELAAFADDLDRHIFDNLTLLVKSDFSLGSGPTLLDFFNVLDQYKSGVQVNVTALSQGYQRRSVKRIEGTRNQDGTITPPNARLAVETSDPDYAKLSGVEISRDSATVNLRIVQDGALIDNATGAVVDSVEGIDLHNKLKSYKQYTAVSDGKPSFSSVTLRISDKRLHRELVTLGFLAGDFDPTSEYKIDLSGSLLVDPDQDFVVPPGVVGEIAQLTVLQKILSALTSGKSETYTDSQLAALRHYHLTAAGYFSPPTTTHYTDLKQALLDGDVDTITVRKVHVGSPGLTDLSKLKSGNAYLQRRFDAIKGHHGVDKVTWDLWWDPTVQWNIKNLSARTQLDGVDELSMPVYSSFLGFEGWGWIGNGLEPDQLDRLEEACLRGYDADETLEVFRSTLNAVEARIEALYSEHIRPLVFFVGATGQVPEGFGKPLDADQLQAVRSVKLSKAENEATFFLIPGGDLILSVYLDSKYFTTAKAA